MLLSCVTAGASVSGCFSASSVRPSTLGASCAICIVSLMEFSDNSFVLFFLLDRTKKRKNLLFERFILALKGVLSLVCISVNSGLVRTLKILPNLWPVWSFDFFSVNSWPTIRMILIVSLNF